MINVKCSSKGMFYVYDENNLVAKINVDKSNNNFKNEINISSGKHLLRFVYQGKVKVSFYKFNLI